MDKWRLSASAIGLLLCQPLYAKETIIEKNRAGMAALTSTEYDAAALLIDDPMSTVAVVTTLPAYKTKSKSWENETDTWLQGGVNRKTGETVMQIGGSIFYTDQWRFYQFATYATDSGPVDAPIQANRKVIGCSGGCKYREDVTVPVKEDELRGIAQSSEPWRLRFHAQNGIEWEEEMNPLEIHAFLAKMDAYRLAHPISH